MSLSIQGKKLTVLADSDKFWGSSKKFEFRKASIHHCEADSLQILKHSSDKAGGDISK